MRGIMRSLSPLFVSLAVLLSAGAAAAVTWEMAFRGLGANAPVQIRKKTTGALVGTYYSVAASSSHYNTNFRIDFAGAFGPDCQVSLEPETTYVLVFPNWSNKACYVQGHEIDPDFPPDDVYDIGINPDHLNLDPTVGDGYQEAWGFPTATYGPPPPTCPTIALVIEQAIPIGDKTTYKLKATATGCGPWTFSWSNATMTTGANTNPSKATRTCLNSQTVTVTVTCDGVQKSIIIGGDFAP